MTNSAISILIINSLFSFEEVLVQHVNLRAQRDWTYFWRIYLWRKVELYRGKENKSWRIEYRASIVYAA